MAPQQQPVPAAVLAQAGDYPTRLAMLTGAALEGGYGPTYNVGDHGHSFGPYQINLPWHPDVTAAQATDASFATAYMLPRYRAAEKQVNPALLQTDPTGWAERVAALAERPNARGGPQELAYYAQGHDVASAYASATQALGGASGPSAGPSVGAPAASLASSSSSSSSGSPQFTLIPEIKTPGVGGFGSVTLFPGIHIAKASLLRVGIGLVGLVLLFIALHALTNTSAGQGPITVVAAGATAAGRNAKQRTGDGFSKLGEAAEA